MGLVQSPGTGAGAASVREASLRGVDWLEGGVGGAHCGRCWPISVTHCTAWFTAFWISSRLGRMICRSQSHPWAHGGIKHAITKLANTATLIFFISIY